MFFCKHIGAVIPSVFTFVGLTLGGILRDTQQELFHRLVTGNRHCIEQGPAMSGQGEQMNLPSEEARKKAQAAKEYIENMYKLQQKNLQERRDRYQAFVRTTSLSMNIQPLV